ncbi:hypothetical protein PHYBLDRAFT_161297 [Phycomyces blakesleeanus NRRL 1555(-)]|uniref:Uncharacterized protein n=1 Tax=Phycomyces blakesleeanus (strain ATCC 8743b / DSM 1359 / FGSC 10004 / NBRC 33097 / NRRL 1555) TaxID=763407 RepID=A0A167R1Z0_PHYB8|nr:hypothetical protein PHYBLDRAFT_161297 [Phycomyces blakesleeanus NRRL 1555(-)]OAD80659.1 hypothetical protein PHYBLDRAFT_161297 [Phycomyces blakesleeanus NRRL 1555(-)]|eukprot:XP_018298699.1 hypothetical protein PHYBLDRAFT_161297 [Phycomyces blakesleeanus NRRL 1555(-)]
MKIYDLCLKLNREKMTHQQQQNYNKKDIALNMNSLKLKYCINSFLEHNYSIATFRTRRYASRARRFLHSHVWDMTFCLSNTTFLTQSRLGHDVLPLEHDVSYTVTFGTRRFASRARRLQIIDFTHINYFGWLGTR